MPDADELKFARRNRTGTVHVVADLREIDDAAPDQLAEVIALPSARPYRTTCGDLLFVGSCGTEQATWTTVFRDEWLCSRCHAALGEDAARAFDHLQPESGEAAY